MIFPLFPIIVQYVHIPSMSILPLCSSCQYLHIALMSILSVCMFQSIFDNKWKTSACKQPPKSTTCWSRSNSRRCPSKASRSQKHCPNYPSSLVSSIHPASNSLVCASMNPQLATLQIQTSTRMKPVRATYTSSLKAQYNSHEVHVCKLSSSSASSERHNSFLASLDVKNKPRHSPPASACGSQSRTYCNYLPREVLSRTVSATLKPTNTSRYDLSNIDIAGL